MPEATSPPNTLAGRRRYPGSTKDDPTLRLGLGAQVTPLPGFTLDVRGRALFPAGEQSGVDLFVQLHFWN